MRLIYGCLNWYTVGGSANGMVRIDFPIIEPPECPLLGESGHRNFDAKPRAYEFANGCLRPKAEIRELHTFDATPILRMTASAYKQTVGR